MSWFGFATLMIAHAGTGKVAGTGDHFIGAFHRLDGHHRLVLDGNRLADVEPGNHIRHAIAELEVVPFLLGRRRASVSTPGRASSGVRSVVESMSSMP